MTFESYQFFSLLSGDKEDGVAPQTTGFGSLRKYGKSTKTQGEPHAFLTPDVISNTTRKNSVPNNSTGFPYLSKLNFSHALKEKKVPSAGSPRSTFRNTNIKNLPSMMPSSSDNEVFTQITLPMNRVRN